MPTTTRRSIVPADRTRDIRYAVRDVIELANKAAAAGRDMIYLNIGDPNIFDLAPPEHMIDATVAAMRANHNGYAPSSGTAEALAAVNGDAARKGIQDICHTCITTGASEAIELALTALVNRGDSVLTPSPGYPLYTALLSKLEAVNRGYELDEENGWQPDLNDIRSKIDERTKAIVLINPNNPTGSLASRDVLEGLIEIALEHNLVIFSDEIYDKLIFDDAEHIATAALSREAKIITFGGLSKNYVVPGFRIGWGIMSGPAAELDDYAEAIQKMERARLSANHPEQFAIKPALEGDQSHLVSMMRTLTVRRDITVERLNAIDGITCVAPQGAFYAFPRIDLGIDDETFCRRVIEETGVVIVPGSGFGQREGTQHFRVVFLPPDDLLATAFDRIEGVVRELKR